MKEYGQQVPHRENRALHHFFIGAGNCRGLLGDILMAQATWRFQLERIVLAELKADANQPLGMVIAQPLFEVSASSLPPCEITEQFRQTQVDAIRSAFLLRAQEADDRRIPMPFVLFPEYSIPKAKADGIDGLALIREQIAAAEEETIFIGGIEGLTPDELSGILEQYPPAAGSEPDYRPGEFVNVAIVVVRFEPEDIRWHYQVKIAPAQSEQALNMAEGRRVLLFESNDCNFLCQICFDHMAAHGAARLNTALCDQLCDSAGTSATRLDLVLVPQYNPSPRSKGFREGAESILSFQNPKLQNYHSSVIWVNRASERQEPGDYGCSGVSWRAGRWQVSNVLGPNGYELSNEGPITMASFRRRTGAIHTFELVPPASNLGNSANLRSPFKVVRSYPLDHGCDTSECSCLATTHGSGQNFVICMPLPCKLRDTLTMDLPSSDGVDRWGKSGDSPTPSLVKAYGETRQRLLKLSYERAHQIAMLLFLKTGQSGQNPDIWGTEEADALKESAASLAFLDMLSPLDFASEALWTAVRDDDVAIAILDGGRRHMCLDLVAQYLTKFSSFYDNPRVRGRTTLIVSVRARGQCNPPVTNCEGLYFTKPTQQEKNSWARPMKPTILCCDSGLIDLARQDDNPESYFTNELQKSIAGQ